MWRLNASHATAWRAWEGEIVVYDDVSGDTLKLDVITAEIFKLLAQGPATEDAIVSHLAQSLELDPEPKLYRLSEIALERLELANLAEAQNHQSAPREPR